MESVSWPVRAEDFLETACLGRNRVSRNVFREKLSCGKRSNEVEGRFAFCNTLNILGAGLTSSS